MAAWYDFFVRTTDEWTAFGTMVTAGTALAASAFGFEQLRQARNLREEQAQPVVVVDFESSPVDFGILDLVVRSTGHTVAYDVKIEFDPPLKSTMDDAHPIGESDLVVNGVPTMPPGKEHRGLFENLTARYSEGTGRFDKDGLPTLYVAKVSFANSKGKRYKLEYRLSLDVYAGLTFMNQYGMHHLAKSMRELASNINKITSGGKLQVKAVDGDYSTWANNYQRRHGGAPLLLGNGYPAGRPSPHKYDYLDASPEVRQWGDLPEYQI